MAGKQQLTEAQVLALQNRFRDAPVAGDATVSSLIADDVIFLSPERTRACKQRLDSSIERHGLKMAFYKLNDARGCLL